MKRFCIAAMMALGIVSCVNIDERLGGDLVATNQKYDIYTAEIPLEITEQVETGVTEVNTAKAVDGNVYSIDGRLVKTHAQDLSGLDQGIYIFNG